MKERESKPRITSHGGRGQVTINGILEDDMDLVLGAFNVGSHWIRVNNGALEISPSWEALPDPIRDEKMHPFWREPKEGEVQLHLVEIEPLEQNNNYTIYIQNLCGYNYSNGDYQMYAELLESYGFECLRSKRGRDGCFWEIWLLPGLWAAKEDLKTIIGNHRGKKALKLAITFLAQKVSFGTLDVSVQRLAATIE